MNYLAIDTHASHLTVVVNFNNQVYSQFIPACGLTHSVILNKTIEEVLDKANASLYDMDFFACVVGAGSFTGIRIGVSCIKAFAFATNKKVLGITSFDTIAYDTDRQKVLAIIDAKNGNNYACTYDNLVAGEPKFISLQELEELKKEYKVYSFNDVNVVNGLINAVNDKINLLTDRENLIPLYVKKSQAEEC